MNSYSQLIKDNLVGIQEKGIATKILQHLDRVRNGSSIAQARRWVMELLQNARDVAYENSPIDICISYDNDKLVFAHNGKPFTVKNLLAIVHQVSSKGELGDGAVGQFGTGFITTYQLSEQVELKSVLEDKASDGTMLPPQPFHIHLDRSGHDYHEIQHGIQKAMDELENLRETKSTTLDRKALNTEFIYHLHDDYARSVAKAGMGDIGNTLVFVMLFSERIDSVTLKTTEGGETTSIRYVRGDSRTLENGLSELVINSYQGKATKKITQKYTLRYMQKDGITLASLWDENLGYLPIPSETSRLFIDFPLIGSENFPFPMVINSLQFIPDEPRSGIALIDREQSIHSQKNMEIIDAAVSLYGEFLDAVYMENADDTKGAANLLSIPLYEASPFRTEEYVKEHIYSALYDGLKHRHLVKTRKGYASFDHATLYIPESAQRKEILKMMTICTDCLTPLPENTDTEDWDAVLYGYYSALEEGDVFLRQKPYHRITAPEAVYKVEQLLHGLGSISALQRQMESAGISADPYQWLNEYLAWAGRYYQLSKLNDFRCFPDHRGNFHYPHNLEYDYITYPDLRNLGYIFGAGNNHDGLIDRLMDPRIHLSEDVYVRPHYGNESVAHLIRDKIERLLHQSSIANQPANIQKACTELMAWIEEHPKEAPALFPEYSSEEGRMKLLTPHAAVLLHQEAREARQLLEKIGASSLEDAYRLVDSMRESYNRNNAKSSEYSYGDVTLSWDEASAYSDKDLEDFCRKVGDAGETYAFTTVVNEYKENGFHVIDGEDSHHVTLRNEDDHTVEILYPDTANYHQEGWDIQITEGGEIRYIEVKTHTKNSMEKNTVHLSKSQLIKALGSDPYDVMLVVYSTKSDACTSHRLIKNVRGSIASGNLRSLDDGFAFRLAG